MTDTQNDLWTRSSHGRPLRILMAADANSAHTVRWVEALAARGHEVGLFTLVDPQDCDYSKFPNVAVCSAGLRRSVVQRGEGTLAKLRYFSVLPALRRFAARWRPQIMHAHYLSSYGSLCALAGLRPLLISVWGSDVFSLPARLPAVRPVLRAVLACADRVLSSSHIMREQARSLTRNAIEVVPFGVDIERFRPASAMRTGEQDTLTIGAVKSLEHTYGMDLLVRAFAQIAQHGKGNNVRLLLVGGGSMEPALREMCVALRIEHLVTFAGQVRYEQVHLQHQKLDIAVYPSRAESFGVAALESQACGIPTVVSRVGGLPEVIEDGRTGLIVPPEQVGALALALQGLLEAQPRRREMGCNAREHVVRNFALDVCVDKLEAIYTSVLTKYCRAP